MPIPKFSQSDVGGSHPLQQFDSALRAVVLVRVHPEDRLHLVPGEGRDGYGMDPLRDQPRDERVAEIMAGDRLDTKPPRPTAAATVLRSV